jgi:hypothetical protein
MIDFKKIPAYQATAKPSLINIPPILYVKIDGEGSPEGDDFQAAIKAVYGIFYAVRFWDKQHKPPKGYDKFTSAPMEAIWWTPVGQEFDPDKPEEWHWTVLIRVPDFVTQEFFDEVINELVSTKGSGPYEKARLETVHEGCSVQMLHLGPYNDEKDSLDRLYSYAKGEGYEIYGRHHEIYLNTPNRTAADKLKTVLRYPVRLKDTETTLNV